MPSKVIGLHCLISNLSPPSLGIKCISASEMLFKREGLGRLRQSDGQIVVDPPRVRAIATDFYRDLLSAEPAADDRVREAREALWSFTRPVVPVHLQRSLLSPFSDVELEEALQALPRGKCPGEDGLSVAFFQRYWDLLHRGIRLAFQEIMETGA